MRRRSVDQRPLGLDLAVGQTAGDVGEDGRSKGHAGAATQRSEPLQLLIQREGHAEGAGRKRRRARNTGSANADERGKTVEERAAFLARPLDVRLNSPDDEIGLQVGADLGAGDPAVEIEVDAGDRAGRRNDRKPGQGVEVIDRGPRLTPAIAGVEADIDAGPGPWIDDRRRCLVARRLSGEVGRRCRQHRGRQRKDADSRGENFPHVSPHFDQRGSTTRLAGDPQQAHGHKRHRPPEGGVESTQATRSRAAGGVTHDL